MLTELTTTYYWGNGEIATLIRLQSSPKPPYYADFKDNE